MEIKLTNVRSLFRKRLLMMIMRTFIFLLCTTVFGIVPKNTFSQDKVIINQDQLVTVDRIFEIIREQTDYKFIYPKKMFKDAPKVQLRKGTIRVDKLLNQSITAAKFNIVLSADNTIVIKEKSKQQKKRVSGIITDEEGHVLFGINVLIKGTSFGVLTDYDGRYNITVKNSENVLVFSFLGFEAQEITVGNQTIINVTLKEAISKLDEITINAGYYKTSRLEMTGSISKIEAKTIDRQPVSNPLQALQGRVPGVYIEQSNGLPGSAFKIRIRGQNSISASGEPFYIVDGVPYLSQSQSLFPDDTSDQIFGISPLSVINPADIESIEILKDADATAIYGSRGANGVVLITTKKGKNEGLKIDVNLSSQFGTVANRMNLLNREQYLEMRNEALANDGILAPRFNDFDINGAWDQTRETDWQDRLFGGIAEIINFNTSISGGNEQTQFSFGAGYRTETSVFPDNASDTKRSTRFSVNHTSLNKKFNIALSANYWINDNLFSGSTGFVGKALRLAPTAPALYDANGNLNFQNRTFNNPFANLEEKSKTKNSTLTTNGSLSYKIIKGLTFKSNFGYTDSRLDRLDKIPISSRLPTDDQIGEANQYKNTSNIWIVEPQLEYEKKLGSGILKVLVGVSFQETVTQFNKVIASGYLNDQLLGNFAAAPLVTARNTESEYRHNAIYGRINYSYKNRYFINLTGRRDGSSRFGPGKQFGNFGAVGASWVFSSEKLLRNSKFLSFGKLRVSYGITGSDGIGNYTFLSLWNPNNFATYEGQQGLNPFGLFNNDFQWESNRKLDLGLDLSFLKNRINLNTSYYRNRSGNQLVGIPLSSITGFSSITANLDAEVENTGLEIELNTINIKTNDFSWSSGINLTIPKNKLISYPNIKSSSHATTYQIGSSLGIEYGYLYDGIDPKTGSYKVKDLDKNGIIDDNDRTFHKTLGQEYFGGLHNNMTYKGFELGFLFQFVKQTGSSIESFFNPPGFIIENQPVSVINRWQKAGDITDIGRYTRRFVEANRVIRQSDRAFTDASFIRLKNISLSYNLPFPVLEKLKLQQLRLYLQGQNLLTFTDYIGLDPESRGTSLPPLRVMSLGVQLTF